MASWNQRPTAKADSIGFTTTASRAICSLALMAGLCREAYIQPLGSMFASFIVPRVNLNFLLMHTSVFTVIYSVLAGAAALLTLLWLVQYLVDLAQCVRIGTRALIFHFSMSR